MKTYLLNAVQRLKNYSQKLDAQAILYDKSWEVFNESGDKELMIFRANNELLISRNGIIQKGKWELLDISNLIIDVGEKSYLLNAAYIEDQFLALKLDGTEQYMVMIETDMKNRFSLNTVKSIEGYLDDRYKKIEQERIRKEKAEQKRIESELRVKELIKKREEEKKRAEELKKSAERLKKRVEEIKKRVEEEKNRAELAKINAEIEEWLNSPEYFFRFKRKYYTYIIVLVFCILIILASLYLLFIKSEAYGLIIFAVPILIISILYEDLKYVRDEYLEAKKRLKAKSK
ncbi:MAG TPA: hypothetical protein GX708_08190 [Gallicola sp.]|nr:hypothetical protein [Gallicola sp.]